jgi:magnesium transporter
MFQDTGENARVGYFYTVPASIAPLIKGRHSLHSRGTIMKMQSSPQTSPPSGPVPLSFCILLYQDGSIERMVDQPLAEYFAAIHKASMIWIDCSTLDDEKDIEQIAQIAGFSKIPIPKLTTGFYSAYEDYDTELGIMLPSVTVKTETMTVHPLFVLIRENIVITVHSDKINRLLRLSRYAPQFFKRISTENTPDKITLMLERIIDENNDRNFEYLREIEMHGDAISKSLIEENLAKRKIAHDIYRMKHVLIDYLNVLWATKDVVDSLRYGDADLITNDEKLLGRIGILSDNIDRHIELSEQMSNVLSSGLEVMQSIYNNQLQNLNNRFALVTAYLTVLGTAFLVPNTIATVAGSGIMEGTMAAQWWYIPLLIGSTVIATLASFLWVLHVWKMKQDDD